MENLGKSHIQWPSAKLAGYKEKQVQRQKNDLFLQFFLNTLEDTIRLILRHVPIPLDDIRHPPGHGFDQGLKVLAIPHFLFPSLAKTILTRLWLKIEPWCISSKLQSSKNWSRKVGFKKFQTHMFVLILKVKILAKKVCLKSEKVKFPGR